MNLNKDDAEHPGVNSMLLQIILQLCDTSKEVRFAIRHTLFDSPALRILCANPLEFIGVAEQAQKISSAQFRAQFIKCNGDCTKKTEFNIYEERLYQLGLNDYRTLKLFAHISGAEPLLKEGVALFLKYGGFFDRKFACAK